MWSFAFLVSVTLRQEEEEERETAWWLKTCILHSGWLRLSVRARASISRGYGNYDKRPFSFSIYPSYSSRSHPRAHERRRQTEGFITPYGDSENNSKITRASGLHWEEGVTKITTETLRLAKIREYLSRLNTSFPCIILLDYEVLLLLKFS